MFFFIYRDYTRRYSSLSVLFNSSNIPNFGKKWRCNDVRILICTIRELRFYFYFSTYFAQLSINCLVLFQNRGPAFIAKKITGQSYSLCMNRMNLFELSTAQLMVSLGKVLWIIIGQGCSVQTCALISTIGCQLSIHCNRNECSSKMRMYLP